MKILARSCWNIQGRRFSKVVYIERKYNRTVIARRFTRRIAMCPTNALYVTHKKKKEEEEEEKGGRANPRALLR